MTPTETELQDLYDRFDHLPYSAESLALIEEAVRLTDLRQDEAEGYRARRRLMDCAYALGQSEKMLVAFTWCRDYADRHEHDLDSEERLDLLWHQRWVVNAGGNFPQLPAARLDALHDELVTAMDLLGAPGLADLTPDLVVPA